MYQSHRYVRGRTQMTGAGFLVEPVTVAPVSIARVTTAKIEPPDSAQSSIVTNTFNAVAGNLIVVVIRYSGGSGSPISSITDTAGNTYVSAVDNGAADPGMGIYYAKNITGNAANAVTVNFSPSALFSWAYAIQYSGANASSPLETANFNRTTATSDLTSGSITTSSAGVVVLGTSQNNFTTYTAGTDFTLLDGSIGNNTGDNFGGTEEYLTSGSLSSYTAHITSGITNDGIVAVAAFKP